MGLRPPTQIFVVHQHAASRIHFDLGLEISGVLKCWALPKGPSLNPVDKRLALRSPDRRLAFASFEGIIPGDEMDSAVLVWDEGQLSIDEAERGFAEGLLRFRLEGSKLRGAWTLARMGLRADDSRWLLLKEADRHADYRANVVVDAPESVRSGRVMADLLAHCEGQQGLSSFHAQA